MSDDAWLCIDQGGQSTRAALVGPHGRVVALGDAPLETIRHGDGRIEHDPDALLASVRSAIERAFAGLGGETRRIRGAALATQRSTLVCARRDTGEALTPAISWQDRRGAAALEAAASAHAQRVHALTGLRVSPHYGVGKLRWCLDNVPEVAAAAAAGELIAAPLAAFVLKRLGAGDWNVDPANASRTLLMDVATLDWSAELLTLFGVERSMLPAIRPCRYDYGLLDAGGAGVPLRVVTGDQSAALYSAGTPPPGTVFVNIGTGAFIQCSTGAERVLDPALLTSVSWQDESSRTYVLEGTVNGAASAVEAALAELRLPRPSATALDAALERIAAAPLYLNGVSGIGSPDWVPDFASRFVGDGTPLEKLAAVYESVVFLIVRNVETMRRRVAIERIVVSGGLSRVDWLAQQLATLTNLPVKRPDDAEATLRGLFVLLRRGEPVARLPARTFAPERGGTQAERYRAWTDALEEALRRRSSVALPAGSG